jgi:MFS family permease
MITKTASAASVYNIGFPSMIRDLHCTQFQATIGLSVYPLGFGLIPLVTASFSEEFGRLPLYIGSGIGFLLMSPMIALYVELRTSTVVGLTLTFTRAKNIQTVIVARFLQGAFGSTGATMVGGTISDIWLTKE